MKIKKSESISAQTLLITNIGDFTVEKTREPHRYYLNPSEEIKIPNTITNSQHVSHAVFLPKVQNLNVMMRKNTDQV